MGWRSGILAQKHWDQLVDFSFEEDHPQFARASLVRQHEFLKALGRPSRENVTTKRDDHATLLQALELTNGQYFNGVLAEGAKTWLEKYSDKRPARRNTIFESIGPEPEKVKKRRSLLAGLKNGPEKEGLQDLFWSTILLPEFQFIY